MATSTLTTSLKRLTTFSACDVSDALLKLKIPNAGHIPNLLPIHPTTSILAAPASTVLWIPKSATPSTHPDLFSHAPTSNIPAGAHWVDLTRPDSVVVMSQPAGQVCAVLGGIMAARMKKVGAKGVVVGGRVRDRGELGKLEMPIWSTGTSTVGSGMEAKAWAINVPVSVEGTTVHPGDIVFSDPIEGVVVIPKDKLEQVLELMPRLVEADDKVKEDVDKGVSVKEAFAKHRSNI